MNNLYHNIQNIMNLIKNTFDNINSIDGHLFTLSLQPENKTYDNHKIGDIYASCSCCNASFKISIYFYEKYASIIFWLSYNNNYLHYDFCRINYESIHDMKYLPFTLKNYNEYIVNSILE